MEMYPSMFKDILPAFIQSHNVRIVTFVAIKFQTLTLTEFWCKHLCAWII